MNFPLVPHLPRFVGWERIATVVHTHIDLQTDTTHIYIYIYIYMLFAAPIFACMEPPIDNRALRT